MRTPSTLVYKFDLLLFHTVMCNNVEMSISVEKYYQKLYVTINFIQRSVNMLSWRFVAEPVTYSHVFYGAISG